MKKKLRITVLMDAACIASEDPCFTAVNGEPTTEYHVVSTLRQLGHQIAVLGVDADLGAVVNGLCEQRPDLVFNLTEVFRGDRCQDRNLAALLELSGLPFTGTGATGLMLCRGKGLCKQLLNLHRLRVPAFMVFPQGKPIRIPVGLRYPMVIKPVDADGSDGIANASLVCTPAALTERVLLVHERWRQAAIAEEYIEGRELYVSVLGNHRLRVLPPREIFLGTGNGDGPQLATYRVKWDPEYQKKWNIRFDFADVSAPLMRRLESVCKRVYRQLQLRDYGRIDLRVTPDERIVVLEVNPNPDIAYGEEVAESAERGGIAYPDLLQQILRLAMRRYRCARA